MVGAALHPNPKRFEMKIENVKEWLANPANLKQEQERIEDVRRHALLDHPFLGDKALRSQVTLNVAAATARTDGKRIEFSPLFRSVSIVPPLCSLYSSMSCCTSRSDTMSGAVTATHHCGIRHVITL